MKNLFKSFLILVFVLSASLSAQTPKNSWMFTFGGKYPRLINHNYSHPDAYSFGAFFGFQRNFSEHVGIRMALNYDYLQGAFGAPIQKGATNAFDLGVDIIYYFVPCEPVTPYLMVGGGPAGYFLDNPMSPTLENFHLAPQFNTGFGLEWALDEEWRFKTEFAYYTVFDEKFDGSASPAKGGVFGTADKSYFSFNIGLNYYLDKGEPSKLCMLYDGIASDIDPISYDRIEEIVKRHIPQEVVKEVVVEKPVSAASEKWILVGVNFNFNSAKITSDSYPILYDAAKTLLRNTNMSVEIQGYTDNVGSENYNNSLSQKRAEAVKAYLISKGVSSSRLRAVGMGEKNPVADNKTAEGRALNRRIEFKIQ